MISADTDRQHEITDTPQNSVYIPYLCLQLSVHMYLLPDSSSISISVCNPVESTGIQSHSAGFHWTPLDSTGFHWDSDRNRGGTVKYCWLPGPCQSSILASLSYCLWPQCQLLISRNWAHLPWPLLPTPGLRSLAHLAWAQLPTFQFSIFRNQVCLLQP